MPPTQRAMTAGRMAHPASYRLMSRNPSAVPRPGVTPTAWQQEVGAAIAAAYGVEEFDPATFVCRGSGTPIGYPVIEIDVPPEEWVVFRPVDRDRGDSVLGISWMGGPPAGWYGATSRQRSAIRSSGYSKSSTLTASTIFT